MEKRADLLWVAFEHWIISQAAAEIVIFPEVPSQIQFLSLLLILPPWPVLNRLGQVGRLDAFAPGQVSYRPRQFQYPMKAAG